MLLVHIYIREHRSFKNVNIPLNGSFDCAVEEGIITLHKKDDTSQFYHQHYCSALVGPNGIGKSTVLDFIERLVTPNVASGIAIFYDSQSNTFHLCFKNTPNEEGILVTSDCHFKMNKDAKKFIEDNNIHLVRINNISADLDVLSLVSSPVHKNVYDCSRNKISNNIGQRSDYLNKLFSYFRSADGVARYIETVYYEILFKSSPRYLLDSILSCPMPEECQVTLAGWAGSYTPVVLSSHEIERGKGAIFQRLLEMNLISILGALCNIDGSRDIILPFLLYRFVKLDSVSPFSLNMKHKLEIVTSPDERFEIPPDLRSSLNVKKMVSSKDVMGTIQKFLSSDETNDTLNDIFVSFGELSENIDNYSGGFSEDADNHFRLNDFYAAEKIFDAIKQLDKDISVNFKCGWRGISSGEFARLHIFSENFNYLNMQKEKVKSIYLLDEIDLYLHPEWQRTFLSDFLSQLQTIEATSVAGKPQIILTTHSPVIISDFISDDIVAFRRKEDDEYSQEYDEIIIGKSAGFGNPIADVYMDGMHLKSTFGELSRRKIDSLIQQAKQVGNGGEWSEYDRRLIDKIDNCHFKNYLKNHAKNK
ncbi:AAA family ATPase [Erwinia persicina]|uniref:AAA family ATPase n=1 Tax=Erwinia persicina TaxID=55211 RepID=UPI0016543762|nr:AAA family ATPase [Erwinia persicina]MBC3947109.1 AAA family ATPase [Erwinia persicina]